MPLRRRQETTLDLSVTRFGDHVDRRLRNTMALKVRLKETHRTILCFKDRHMILKTVTQVPPTEKLEAFNMDDFLSLEQSSKAIGGVLRGSFSDDPKERYFEGVISYLAHVHAKDAVASGVDTVALKAEFEVMITDILEPSEKCMACLVEFRQREAVERKPCGHTYHEDCLEYYIKNNIDCPTCYCGEPESSSKSSSGAGSIASEEDIIKVSCDFPNTDDDESEEETSDETRGMCMVCLVEFRPREVVKRKACGHTYHEDCMEYYIKHNVDCPTCYYYDDPASSSKFSSGAREFASEEDIIKMSSKFLYSNDDGSEEESSDEPGEMCMMCLVEFQPREAVERKPCGHTYHEDCLEYYIKHNVDCPTRYYYDDPASSSKFSSGAREFASEEDIIKMSSKFLYSNDDESEEESIDEPGEMCMMCLVEFQPREAVERKPCGHTYHEDCLEYYIKNNIDCPTCYYYDDPASSSKFSSGAREFASEEDIIKMSSKFLYSNDDESEEENFDEPGEMCMVCLIEFQPREAVERKPCGHTFHEDCLEYYIEHDIECPTCLRDIFLNFV